MNRSMAIPLALLVLISVSNAGPQKSGARPGYGLPGTSTYKNAQTDYWEVWRGFKTITDSLLKTLGATNSEAASLLMQVQTNAAFLDDKWNVWFSHHRLSSDYAQSDDYLIALRADSKLLSSLKKEKDAAKALNILRDVALDLQLKADNCRNSSDGLGKQIKVKVHTKAGEKEIGGYEVFYVQKGMFDVKSAHDRFPRQSSPTDEKILCPGGYAMWARKKNFTSEPITMRIGGRGETKLEVDIVVPSE